MWLIKIRKKKNTPSIRSGAFWGRVMKNSQDGEMWGRFLKATQNRCDENRMGQENVCAEGKCRRQREDGEFRMNPVVKMC